MPDAHDARNLDENTVIVQSVGGGLMRLGGGSDATKVVVEQIDLTAMTTSFKIDLQTRISNKYFEFVENEIVE